jgi:glycosyltransferase
MATISIITATYNAAPTIADCLRSVNAQGVPVEQIVIDGASGDATLEIVRRVSPAARIVSEPDEGLYHAMNKGIGLATGEVVGILNADDFYASPDVLEKVLHVFEDPAVMSCYGDLEYVVTPDEPAGDGVLAGHPHCQVVRYWRAGSFSPDKFSWGWMPPHPTFFVRRSVYERFGPFRLDLGSAADYELMLRLLLKERNTTAYIPQVLVRMRTGGVSNRSLTARLKANHMDRRAWDVNGLTPYPWTMICKPLRKVGQYFCRK